MNTFKRKKRYNFMNYVLIILFSILSFQLFYLTVVKGNYYRNIADNIRIKDVQIPAARGNIYDRNGKLLAGTMPVFTLQILKDEFNREPLEKRNEVLLKLTRLLDEDGSYYYDENSFELYGFEYETKNEYLSEELSPEDKIIKILIDNNLRPAGTGRHAEGRDGTESHAGRGAARAGGVPFQIIGKTI